MGLYELNTFGLLMPALHIITIGWQLKIGIGIKVTKKEKKIAI